MAFRSVNFYCFVLMVSTTVGCFPLPQRTRIHQGPDMLTYNMVLAAAAQVRPSPPRIGPVLSASTRAVEVGHIKQRQVFGLDSQFARMGTGVNMLCEL